MRCNRMTLAVAAASLLVAPQLAAADDVQDQLRQMQERMTQLEDQLSATNEQLDQANDRVSQQQDLIEQAGLDDESSSLSSLARFFEETEFGGWIAVNYFYNTNNPDNSSQSINTASTGVNTGGGAFAGSVNPFTPDHDTFQVDQLWFSMENPATEESRGGFAADIVFGRTAEALRGESNANGFFGGDEIALYQAYVQYLAPVGPNGVNLKMGRFETVIGAEYAQSNRNFNITRGMTYTILQPFNHVGLMASMDLGGGFDIALGVTNDSLGNLNVDNNSGKNFLWHLGWATDTLSIGINGLYGGNASPTARAANFSGDDQGIVDVLINWDPSENLSAYLNFDYVWTEKQALAQTPQAYGIALAGRYGITETLGFALRGEYIRSVDSFVFGGGGAALNPVGAGDDQNIWTLTGTFDYLVTDNLTLKAEVKYETASTGGGDDNNFYVDNNAVDLDNDQVLLGAEVTYEF